MTWSHPTKRAAVLFLFAFLLTGAGIGSAKAADEKAEYAAVAMADELCFGVPGYDLKKISAAIDKAAGQHIKPEVGKEATKWTFHDPSGRKLILARDPRPGRLKCSFQASNVAFSTGEKWLDNVSAAFAEQTKGKRQKILSKSDPVKGSAAFTTVETKLGPMFFGVWSTPDGGVLTSMGPLKEFVVKGAS